MKTHDLNHNNYFSKEADLEYMSVSQFKNFNKCSAKAVHDLQFDMHEEKEAFIEGSLFEALTIGDAEKFLEDHPEIVSSQGPTKGQIKANYKKVVKAADRFNEQKFFRDIISKCEKQVILVGEIEGIKVKCCLDLFYLKNKKIYDVKCMANFNEEWDKEEKCYKPWYYTYGYVLQLAIYQEIVRQNFGIICDVHLMAASKEEEPDLKAEHIDNDLLKLELEEFKSKVKTFDAIKKGDLKPIRCENCKYCKSTKVITKFTEVK